MERAELEEIRRVYLKARMFLINNMEIRLTRDELDKLAKGNEKDFDRWGVYNSLGVPEDSKNGIEKCCLYGVFGGVETSKIDNPLKKYAPKRPDVNEIRQGILDSSYLYQQTLNHIRKKIIIVDNPIAYNSELK